MLCGGEWLFQPFAVFSLLYDHRPCEGNANNVHINKRLINTNPNLAPKQSSSSLYVMSLSVNLIP